MSLAVDESIVTTVANKLDNSVEVTLDDGAYLAAYFEQVSKEGRWEDVREQLWQQHGDLAGRWARALAGQYGRTRGRDILYVGIAALGRLTQLEEESADG